MLTPRVKELIDSSKSPLTMMIWDPSRAVEYAEKILSDNPAIVFKRSREYQPDGSYTMKKTEFYNIPCAFDIESTSFVSVAGEKCGLMYVWQLAIAGHVMMGRTWEQFTETIQALRDVLGVNDRRKLIIYIHNAAFEFQFMHHYFHWSRVFAVDDRKPVYFECDGLEFRCSYILSGYPLAKLHEALHEYKNVQKAVGDLDYRLLRTPETPLTWREKYYCVMDVVVLSAYIDEKIDEEGRICDIPLTNTGYVRRYCREACLEFVKGNARKNRQAKAYKAYMEKLQLTLDQYMMLRRAFQGGFTHANAYKAGKTYYNVSSRDFTSSYPAVMISYGGFPASSPKEVTDWIKSEDDLIALSKKYALIMDIAFYDIESTVIYERIIPVSKIKAGKGVVADNGRLVSAERGRMIITEVDYIDFADFYTWKQIAVNKVIAFKKDYLPTPLVEAILALYKSKTELKGVDDQEFLYMLRKGMCNSSYGMMVTDIIRAINEYDLDGGEWFETIEPEKIPQAKREELITKYNEDGRRFLYYAWGVYVTAVARHNLYTAIKELKTDYIYSDTDSVKYLNDSNHTEYFEKYNADIEGKMKKALAIHGLPLDAYKPKTIKGKEKPLGVWDKEPDMLIFKTLGAKRYIYMSTDYKIHLTVSGVNKNIAVPYLVNKYGKYGIFKAFAEGLEIPAEYTGKLTHYYIDSPRDGILVDYKGTPYEYHVKSAIYLEPASYKLTISPEYRGISKFLNKIFTIRSEQQ